MEARDRQLELVSFTEDVPFRARNITYEARPDGNGMMPDVLAHWHPELEVVYTFAGHAEHYVDGSPCRARPGGIIIVNPESIHKVLSDTRAYRHGEVVAVVLHVAQDFLRGALSGLGRCRFRTDAGTACPEAAAIMREFSRFVAGGGGACDPCQRLHLTGRLYELLSLLCRDCLVRGDGTPPGADGYRLRRTREAIGFVAAHWRERITEMQVAADNNVSKEYFARSFKKDTGMTFMEYVTRYRLERARQELVETRRSVLDIALDNGFSDGKGLINAFKACYGTTPLQYRKQADRTPAPAT